MNRRKRWQRRNAGPLATVIRKISVVEWMASVISFFGVLFVASQSEGAIGVARQFLSGDMAASTDQTFSCVSPYHHDGDAIRCGFAGRSMRLYGIDAPEMPGACRPGRQCTPGDPYAARDHLVSLTQGRSIRCQQVDTDSYGRQVVKCSAGELDLSCQMVRDGYAVERYGRLSC